MTSSHWREQSLHSPKMQYQKVMWWVDFPVVEISLERFNEFPQHIEIPGGHLKFFNQWPRKPTPVPLDQILHWWCLSDQSEEQMLYIWQLETQAEASKQESWLCANQYWVVNPVIHRIARIANTHCGFLHVGLMGCMAMWWLRQRNGYTGARPSRPLLLVCLHGASWFWKHYGPNPATHE